MKFQNPSLIFFLNGRKDKRTNERTRRNQYVPHFFKVGGIKIKSMDSRVQDVEKSSSFVSGQFGDQKKKLKAADNELKSLNKKCHDFEGIVKKLEEKMQHL